MHTRRRARARSAIIGLLLVEMGCSGAEPGTVLLDLAAFSEADVPGLRDVRALLTVETTGGQPATLNVFVGTDDGAQEWRLVESPVPLRCVDGVCTLTFTVDRGQYQVALDVFARDRCGSDALVAVAFPNGGNPVALGAVAALDLSDVRYAFDDDDDGVENILEPLACGRFDHDDRDAPARFCAEAGDPCCVDAPGRALVSRMGSFAGGTLLRADGSTTTVAPFSLDATEVTFGSFVRCVVAGACLADLPEHPVRVAAATADHSLPVTGLLPGEAQSYCAWLGKRLPTDDEWDFAAAYVDDATRAALPFDPDAPEILLARAAANGGRIDDEPATAACEPTDARPAFNHRALGESCPNAARPVGSYPSSHNHRGEGAPLADLAGNVFEWSLDVAALGPTTEAVPAGTSRVRLRGGYYGSAPLLVENDYPVTVEGPPDDAEFAARLTPYLGVTGFRCAAELDLSPPLEPACPAR